jgi:uncharacterized protein
MNCIRTIYFLKFLLTSFLLLCVYGEIKAENIRNIFDARIAMRDGVELSADIWLPAQTGRYPAILVRTPYVKALYRPGKDLRGFIAAFAEQGYVSLYQDVRGRGDSDGKFLTENSGRDGYDTIEWIANQPWSNGRVCMMGVSALASMQWAAARLEPPHLNCMVPTASGAFQQVIKTGGAIGLSGIQWAFATSGRMMQPPVGPSMDWERISWHRPLLTIDQTIGKKIPIIRKFLDSSNAHYDPLVIKELNAEDYRRINIPALHVTGWFDMALPGALMYWKGMTQHSPAKDQQYLLIGPWDHAQTMMGGATSFGEMEFTENSIVDVTELHKSFFEYYLKGTSDRFDFPYARIYVTGSNKWRDFDVYPPRESTERRLYFHSDGEANSLYGDGRLSWSKSGDAPSDTYIYDPKNPVPAGYGDLFQPRPPGDQRSIETRDDVLVYTSEVLETPLEIIGEVSVELYAASDGRDTDFTVKLIDVYSDGRAIRLGSPNSGIIRARFRNGLEQQALLTPGKIEKYSISLLHIGHTFLPGHRLRVEVSSSAYPTVLPNQNTGNPIETDTEWRVAHQTVYHNNEFPSALVLPVYGADSKSK